LYKNYQFLVHLENVCGKTYPTKIY
jgi:hypothetical protein